MATKILLAIIAVHLLTVQQIPAKPAASNNDHFKTFNLCKLKDSYATFAPSEKDNNLKPSEQFKKFMLFELQELVLSYLRKGNEISEQLLKESILKTNTSPEMKKFKEDLENFEMKYNKCKDMTELFNLIDVYSKATTDYYELEKENSLSSDGKVILDVLNKYNVKEIYEEFEHKFLNTIDNFDKKINELKDKLKAEGDVGVKILNWWEDLTKTKTKEEIMEEFMAYMR